MLEGFIAGIYQGVTVGYRVAEGHLQFDQPHSSISQAGDRFFVFLEAREADYRMGHDLQRFILCWKHDV